MKLTALLFSLGFLFQLIGIGLVSHGLLFIREELGQVSSLSPLNNSTEWFEQKAKVIFLIIDALRFDFFHYNETLSDTEALPYQNRFKKVHTLLKKNPQNFVLLPLYDDPPTATLHRIQSFIVGNLPPFVKVTMNFWSSVLLEDNVLTQLKDHGYKITLLGDRIWTEILPDVFTHDHAEVAFDLDLDNIDDLIKNNIFKEIKEDDFDLILAHGAGVDHAGHRYGSISEKMAGKLSDMDELVHRIIQEMDNNTVLMVVGDHGMSVDGNHGGGTTLETSSALFGYYKGGLAKLPGSEGVMNFDPSFPTYTTQLDISPTLSMLLGIPISANNVGFIINDLHPLRNKAQTDISDLKEIIRSNWINSLQIHHYVVTIQETYGKYSKEEFTLYTDKFESIRKDYEKLNISSASEAEIQSFLPRIADMKKIERMIYEITRKGVKFDVPAMVLGVIILSIALHFNLIATGYVSLTQKIEGIKFRNTVTISFDRLWEILKSSILIVAITIFPLRFFTVGFLKVLGLWTIITLIAGHYMIFKNIRAYNTSSSGNFFLYYRTLLMNSMRESYVSTLLAIGFNILPVLLVTTLSEVNVISLQYSVIIFFSLEILFKFSRVSGLKGKLQTLLAGLFLIKTVLLTKFTTINEDIDRAEDIIRLLPSFWYFEAGQMVISVTLFLLYQFYYCHFRGINRPWKRSIVTGLNVLSNLCLLIYYCTPTFINATRLDYYLHIFVPRVIYLCVAIEFILWICLKDSNLKASISLMKLLFLLAGKTFLFNFVLLLFTYESALYLIQKLRLSRIIASPLFALIGLYGYFSTGHGNQLSTLQVQQSFIGFPNFNFLLSGLLLLLNTVSSLILSVIFYARYVEDEALNSVYPSDLKDKEEVMKLHKEGTAYQTSSLHAILFISMMIATSAGCIHHEANVRLIRFYQPQFLIDTAIFFCTSLFMWIYVCFV